MMEHAVGVIGGIGPLATAYYYELVLSKTLAEKDQDHVNMILFNHASIPDRTAYICGKSPTSPAPVMIEDAKLLEQCGAEFLVIPCNTAHYFYHEIAESIKIPVLNMVEETVRAAKRRFPQIQKLGLLATDGTVNANTYASACAAIGVECVTPDPDFQKKTMSLIYDTVKAGKKTDPAALTELLEHMRDKGCTCTVLGCTELSVAQKETQIYAADILDSLDVLAERTVALSGKKLKEENV